MTTVGVRAYDGVTLPYRAASKFATSGTHTIELRVTGTRDPLSASRRVDLDAVVVLE
jgi:hypothetical protein